MCVCENKIWQVQHYCPEGLCVPFLLSSCFVAFWEHQNYPCLKFTKIVNYVGFITQSLLASCCFYDKRDDFNFHITNFPFLSSNIPSSPAYGVFISQLIRYARACSSYEYFILRARRLSSKLLKQGYLVERLKSSFRKFYGRYGDLIEQYGVTLSRMLNDILTLDQQWLTYRSDFPPISWPLYRAWPSPNYERFPWIICNGCG